MRLAMRIFFRKIYLIKQSNVPKKTPVILACTHPNSFLDDMLMATISDRPLHFLARGDVFKNKWGKIVLDIFNVHPIYRASEFKNDLDKNKESFALSRDVLAKNGVIIIHPEGICVHEKRVRNLRKGIGRIAFGAEEETNWELGLKIVPVALNYTDAPKGGEDVMVLFGDPINVRDYKEIYEQNKPKALLDLNIEIKKSLDKNTISIENPSTDRIINHCLQLGRNNLDIEIHSTVSRDKLQFDLEKKWANKLNNLHRNNTSAFNELEQKVSSYFNLLKKNQLKDINITRSCKNLNAYFVSFIVYEGLFLAFGYFFNILPVKLAQSLTKKKVKLIEFRASVFYLLSLIFFHIVYIILLVFLSIFLGWWAIPLFFGLAFIAYRTPKNHQRWLHFKGCLKLSKLKNKHPLEQANIIQLRKEIVGLIQK